ncbi:hypothetical protein [Laspinema olomoucense]|uniref:hypothetical protein n=1 Tax=Laspinema olomoucense TaxID=3231600 RepID=UPI0021BA477C|nr:hypothetical protein [Laspinema sp. D3d]MCT7975238.1 hypothetical protein [Laspinema sp. D3d]
MKDFRELKLIGSMEQQEKLLEAVEQQLKDGWTRDRDKEATEKSRVDITYKIFVCSQRGSRPAAALFFVADENNYFYITNIVSPEIRNGEVDKYNQVWEEFYSKFIEPIASNFDVDVITTPAERTIENSMSPEVAECLLRFSNAANKSSGGSHPYDEERFLDFIIQAHQEGSLLDESQLRKLLMIDKGWSEENASKLSCEYRFGMDLLKRYDKK